MMVNKAIIGLENWDTMQARATAISAAFDAGIPVPPADYHLNFANAAQLFAALTPARLHLLESLKRGGAISRTTLCRTLARDPAAVDADLEALCELGLVAATDDGKVYVPWSEIQFHFALAGKAAA